LHPIARLFAAYDSVFDAKQAGIAGFLWCAGFNLGCSGFVYGLGLAKGLIESGQARTVLLITADTYSKYIHQADKSVRTLFGDGAAATLIRGVEAAEGTMAPIGPFVNGSDGRGGCNLMVPAGGMRQAHSALTSQVHTDEHGNARSEDNLVMNGSEVFAFTLRAVPTSAQDLLERAGKTLEEIDLFVFHQANRYMLEHLRKKIGIAPEKFFISLEDCGNTVSATIPIALKRAQEQQQLKKGDLVMVVGFGVGYSWSAALLRWENDNQTT
jgi:3-oxoacyl-[acyl-carrier-protein] synthase-3